MASEEDDPIRKGQPKTSTPNNNAEDPEKAPATATGGEDDIGLTRSDKPSVLRRLLRGREPNPLRWRPPPPIPTERRPSPEESANWISRATFHWIAPLMTTGYLRTLHLNDLPLINHDRSARTLNARLSASFTRRHLAGQKNPLLWALHEVLLWDFYLGGLARIIADLLLVMAPFLMKYLISYANRAYEAGKTGEKGPDVAEGVGYVLGITAMQVVASFCLNQFLYRGMCTGGMARAGLIAMVFEKSLRISGRARAGLLAAAEKKEDEEEEQDETGKGRSKKDKKKKKKKSIFDEGAGAGWTNGRIVNLMGTDTYRVDQAASWFHLTWTSPVLVLVTLVVLIVNITYSALAGFGLLMAAIPLMSLVIKSLTKRRIMMNRLTDQRVGLMQEILLGVKFVKYYAWERSFLKDLGKVRDKEVRAVQVILGARGGVNAIGMSLPIFASMLAFITYSTTGNALDPAPIFSSLALFNVLRLPLNLLPVVVGQVIDAWVSLKRIEEFLIAEEITDASSHDLPPDGDIAVKVEGGEFTWEADTSDGIGGEKKEVRMALDEGEKEKEKEKEPFKLRDVNLEFKKGSLTAVVGGVGSGKSSLLAAIAGDMRKTEGRVRLREGDNIGYCPQYAWIQNASIKDNIIFAAPPNPQWYERVTQACALPPDFAILPHGDLTEIGERGITISGGQKARINIARAIYFDASIVLMDDPLSAVDAHVGRHLFDEAICGLLKDKAVVLATHQLHVLKRCDHVVWMEGGRVRDQGGFEELFERNEGFREMMASTSQEGEEEGGKTEAAEEEKEEDELEELRKEITRKSVQEKKAPGLMQAEEKANASVPWSVYAAYVRASGTLWAAPILLFLLCLSQVSNIFTTLWLGYWTSNKYSLSQGQYIGIFAGLGVVQSILFFVFAYSLTIAGTRSSKRLMERAMERVLRAPMSFFDTTPMGRIVNRFSKDVDVLDNTVTDAVRMYAMTLAMILSVFILIIVFFPWFAIALVPLAVFFFFAAGYYRASAREVKRHEAVLRSHVFAKFGEGLSGTACIRAYGLQERFTEDLVQAIDQMDSAYFVTFANQRWLSLRLDCIGNSLVFTVGILVVTSRVSINPSISAVVLSYILQIVGMIQWMIRQLAEVENAMNAAERLHYYGTSLPSEPPFTSPNPPPASWPEHGAIKFNSVSMRYRPGLPLVLKNLSLDIAPGERIAIVGRTGAGKSTIMTTLFRLVELSSGNITIDGIDIATIGLHELRRKLAIIPQDPTLFRGTIRSNLDPFGEKSDAELWSALRASHLVSDPTIPPLTPTKLNDESSTSLASSQTQQITLDTPTEEAGTNFSLGQRQLLALARALIRDARIIIADEATSSVDLETDAKIQETMREGFKGRTVLTIAHRLRTVTRYDRVVVMGAGEVIEMGAPANLWEEGGEFRGMCDRGGVGREDFDWE